MSRHDVEFSDQMRLKGDVRKDAGSKWPMLPAVPAVPTFRGTKLRHSSLLIDYNNTRMKKMLLGLSEALPSLVDAKFKAAKASSSLLFSPTELSIIRTSSGIPVRTCPQCTLTENQLHFKKHLDVNLTQLTKPLVPTPLLPLPRQKAHPQTRPTHPNTQETLRPLRLPLPLPPHNRHPHHLTNAPPSPEQIPHNSLTLHPGHKNQQTTNTHPRTRRSGSDICLLESVVGRQQTEAFVCVFQLGRA